MLRRSCLTLFSHAVFPVFVSTVSPQKYSEELLHILYLLFLVLTSFPMSSSCPPVLLSLSLQILCFTNTSQSSQDVTVLFNLLVFFGFIIWLKACSPLHKPNCVFSLIDGKLNVDSDARCRSLTACFQLLENMLGSEQISFINTRDLVQTYRLMKGLPAGQALGRGQAQSRPPFSFFSSQAVSCPLFMWALSGCGESSFSICLLSLQPVFTELQSQHSAEMLLPWSLSFLGGKPSVFEASKTVYIRFILVSENV